MHSNYQVIARRWRPKSFTDLVGQSHIVQTLSNAIELGRIAHAYLFVGPRGTGKTSTARLFAQALNCENGPCISPDPNSPICQAIAQGSCMDVIEIDGASNNSVDQIRNLRDDCQYAPTQCRFKIYIIDEVHMLSTAAFNALLKTLEEPPPHVKFIFATTEAQKVLPTIVSRCQRFEFRPIADEAIIQKLQLIALNEGDIQIDAPALSAIARLAKGGMRDAQSILDQLIAFCGKSIQEKDVIQVYGLLSHTTLQELGLAILTQNYTTILHNCQNFANQGVDFSQIIIDLQLELKNKLLKALKENDTSFHPDLLIRTLESLKESENDLKNSLCQTTNLEVALLKASLEGRSRSIDSLIQSISKANNVSLQEIKTTKKEEIPNTNSISTKPLPEQEIESYIQRLPTSTQAILDNKFRAEFKTVKRTYLDKMDERHDSE